VIKQTEKQIKEEIESILEEFENELNRISAEYMQKITEIRKKSDREKISSLM